MRLRGIIILGFILNGLSCSAFSMPDSVGVERAEGKIFILHKVDPKETLYSISRKYSVSVDAITQSNPGSEMGITIGQVLKIPKGEAPEENVAENETLDNNLESDEVKTHTVKPGETLYAISTLYPCSVEQIKEWNDLSSNALDVGQKLLVSEPISSAEVAQEQTTEDVSNVESTNETVDEVGDDTEVVKETNKTSISEDDDNSITESNVDDETSDDTDSYVKEDDRPIDIDIQIKTKQQIDRENTERLLGDGQANDSLPSKKTVDMGGYTKVFEKGYAVLMEGTSNDERYLAYHRTAPEGTIMQIRNLNNGKNVFVRVVGKLEHENPKVIISVSAKAEIRLKSGNSTFLTEVSYIP